ncbi:MAG: SGNH/GDSL hydrolase family protein [Actinomycetota bacterium]
MVLLCGTACIGGGPPRPAFPSSGPSSKADPIVYVAVGASETAGVGTNDPFRDAWPKVFWRILPPGSVMFDFGVSGSTAREALADQVGQAVAQAPDLATVWLNVNDLIAGMSANRYGRILQQIVQALRRGGETTVLVANTPRLDGLPVYFACRSSNGLYTTPLGNVVQCPPGIPSFPPPRAIRNVVDAFNREIQRVVTMEGALLVDLNALGDVPRDHPEYVSDDGFHPSSEGAAVVAAAFTTALQGA